MTLKLDDFLDKGNALENKPNADSTCCYKQCTAVEAQVVLEITVAYQAVQLGIDDMFREIHRESGGPNITHKFVKNCVPLLDRAKFFDKKVYGTTWYGIQGM